MEGRGILKAVFQIIGFIFLWIKFKGKKSFQDLKLEAEENSFAIEGGKVILFIVGIIMLIGTLAFLFVVIYRIIVDFFKN